MPAVHILIISPININFTWECLQIPMCLHITTRISYTSTSFCHTWKLQFRFQEAGSFSSQFPLNRGEILKKQAIFSAVLLLPLLSHFSRVRLCTTPENAAHRPWDSPGKNTGVGCRFLLQCMKVKSESEVAQSCLTLSDPMDCSPPGCSFHVIFQARVLEWGAIAFSNFKVQVSNIYPIY